MDGIVDCLKPITVDLQDLLLDPNNPRFSELGEGYNEIPESRFNDEKVQKATFDKMRDPSFNVSELRDTIKTIGFLPMDRIVVRQWSGPEEITKYIVIEGNRRVTALKWLIQLEDVGKETFTEKSRENLTILGCLELDTAIAPEAANLILPGLRHVSGIKEWGPYQKAKAINALRETGMAPQEAAQSLGLSTRAANNAYRCFVALENMKEDEEFGEFVEPNMYSYFEEIFKKPAVKNWLGWQDDKESFEDKEKLHEFYGWMIPPADTENDVHKLPGSKSVRDLAKVIDDDAALSVFRSNEGTLARALAKYELDHPEDWYPKITSASGAIKSLTVQMLKDMDDVTLSSLTGLKAQIEEVLRDRDNLLAKS